MIGRTLDQTPATIYEVAKAEEMVACLKEDGDGTWEYRVVSLGNGKAKVETLDEEGHHVGWF